MKYFLLSLLLLAPLSQAQSGQDDPVLVTVSADSAFIIEGFDSNDRTQVVINGKFPDSCYQVGPYDAYVNPRDNKIHIYQKAYLHKGLCMDVIVPYSQTIELNLLGAGNYEVIDGVSLKRLGTLRVAQAKSPGPGSDDFPYAPVTDVQLQWGDSAPELVLTGEFTNRCMKIKEVQVRYQEEENIVVVLPIVEKIEGEDGCEQGLFRFQEIVPLKKDLIPSTYLFHVRLMNGQALNKMLTLLPQ